MRCQYPWPLKVVRFVENSLSFNQLNISHADITCSLENDVGEAARSTQTITLYITVNITPPNLYSKPPSIPIEDDGSPAEITTIPGRIQFPAPEHLLPPPGPPQSRGRKEMSPTGIALHRADEAMKQIVPIDRSDTWERAVGRVKWVMDTLSPIAEVRVPPIDVLG
jgi:hypothetical protein